MFGPEIIRLRNQGLSYRKIEKELGCSRSTISYHCTKAENHQPLPQSVSLTGGVVNQICALASVGVRKSDIADALDVSYSRVLSLTKDLKFDRTHLTNYEKVKLRRRHLKLLAVVRKGGKCSSCGYHRSIQALDFHHPDPKGKDFNISRNANRAWKAVKVEVDKCILLCSNCHRERHDEYLDENGADGGI